MPWPPETRKGRMGRSIVVVAVPVETVAVVVEVYDLLGKIVSLRHDGVLRGGRRC